MPRDPFVSPGAQEQGPVARRRRRRLLARYRRPALAAAAALLVALSLRALTPASAGQVAVGAGAPTAEAAAADGPRVPAGRVLVTVVPADAAVLQFAVPGSRVDLYAVSTWAAGAPEPARQVASAAVVVRHPSSGPGPTGSAGAVPLQPAAPSALALAVRDSEAGLIAAAQGQAMTVAVLPGP